MGNKIHRHTYRPNYHLKFLKLFTFLPVAECEEIAQGDINKAKERLAYEVTKIIHGAEEADKALAGAKAAFGGGGDKSSMPTIEMPKATFDAGIGIIDLYATAKLGGSKSDIRRLVEQGGIYITNNAGEELQISDVKTIVTSDYLDKDNEIILRAGKKKFIRVITK